MTLAEQDTRAAVHELGLRLGEVLPLTPAQLLAVAHRLTEPSLNAFQGSLSKTIASALSLTAAQKLEQAASEEIEGA